MRNEQAPRGISGLERRRLEVCLPAFSSMNYTTQQNGHPGCTGRGLCVDVALPGSIKPLVASVCPVQGPVWIMGTPLFYSYKVQYDREPEQIGRNSDELRRKSTKAPDHELLTGLWDLP